METSRKVQQENKEVRLKKYLRYLPRKIRESITKEDSNDGNSNDDDDDINSEDDPLFSRLPDELVHEIFSYLSVRDVLLGASAVSRRFRRLCAFTSSEIDLETVWKRNPWMGPTHFKQMVSLSSVYLRVLRLEPSYFFLEQGDYQWNLMEVAAFALKNCPLLEKLEMSRLDSKKLDRSSLKALKRHGGSLRKLSLLLDKDAEPCTDFSVKDLAQINVRLICCAPETDPSEQNSERRKLESFEIRTYFYRGGGGGEGGKDQREEVPQCLLQGTKELFCDGVTRKNYAFGILGARKILEKLVISSDKLHGSNLQSIQQLPRIKELFISTYWQAPFFGPREMVSTISMKLRQLTDCLLHDPDLNNDVVKAVAELVKLSLDSVLITKVRKT